jgi:hypothetical protein
LAIHCAGVNVQRRLSVEIIRAHRENIPGHRESCSPSPRNPRSPCPGIRTHYLLLPKWRNHADRPSCLDLIALLRKEMIQNATLLVPFGLKLAWKTLELAAAA